MRRCNRPQESQKPWLMCNRASLSRIKIIAIEVDSIRIFIKNESSNFTAWSSTEIVAIPTPGMSFTSSNVERHRKHNNNHIIANKQCLEILSVSSNSAKKHELQ